METITFKMLLTQLKEWVGLLTPFAVAVGFLWKIWLKKRYDELRDLYYRVQMMSMEFKPNGGSSLRDAINRIEHTVTLNEQKTLAIIKSMPDGSWLSDERGKCIDVNKSMCKILQRTESELRGDNWSNWVHPDEREDIFDEWNRCVDNDFNFDQEIRFVLPDGKIQKVHAVAYQLKDRSGKLIGLLGTLNPV